MGVNGCVGANGFVCVNVCMGVNRSVGANECMGVNVSGGWCVMLLQMQAAGVAPCCLLELYFLATAKVLSGWAPTTDSVYSWQLYGAAPLRKQTAGTLTRYPTQSHYPDTEPTNPHPILLMPNARLGSDKY